MTTDKERQKQYDDDDGRVICDMNVPGMPWYEKNARKNARRQRKDSGDSMTPREARRYTFYAVLAGLAVVGIFSAAGILFILFCTKVWFR